MKIKMMFLSTLVAFPIFSIQPAMAQENAQSDAAKKFVSIVLKMTEDTWSEVFSAAGKTYSLPTLVLYTKQTAAKCGRIKSEMGPLYCGADQKLYLDPSFFQVLAKQFNSPGDFSRAYVIAHEIGHHIQNITGVLTAVRSKQMSNMSRAQELQIGLELHADCLAGAWAQLTDRRKNIIEPGDLDAALKTAFSIGDDSLAQMAGVKPDSKKFTHGTGEQRSFWFKRGFDTGDYRACTEILKLNP